MSGTNSRMLTHSPCLRAWISAAWLLLPTAAHAAPKVDVIQLKNGDRLTCEILKLQQGSLSISTDPLDKVSVHWADVVVLTSPREFEVNTESGDKYYGSLGTARPGEIIVTAAGGVPVPLRLAEVTSITPIGSSVWSRMDGNLDVGFSFAQANLETRWTFNAGASYRSRKYQFSATGASQLTAREDSDDISRHSVSVIANRLLTDQWFVTGISQVQRNQELNLDLRWVVGGGAGKTLSQSNYRLFTLFGGVVYTSEQFTNEPFSNSAELTTGAELDFFNPGKKGVNWQNSILSYYSLNEAGRVRLELESAWRHDFMNDFYWSLNTLESFDSHPPDNNKKNDVTVSVAIGWKF